MKNKFIVLMLVFIIMISTSCHEKSVASSGVYIFGFEEIVDIVDNVYIGTVISIDSTFESQEESYYYPIIKYRVLVEESLKGDLQTNVEIVDYALYNYKDFLETGERYCFCTGVNKESSSDSIIYYNAFNPYCAIKIIDSDNIEIYNWDNFKKYEKYQQNHVEQPPKSLTHIRNSIININITK